MAAGCSDSWWVPKDIAATPYGVDVMASASRLGELLTELANKDVNDLKLGLVHSAIEMVEEHLLGQSRALAQAEQLKNTVLLAGQVNRLIID